MCVLNLKVVALAIVLALHQCLANVIAAGPTPRQHWAYVYANAELTNLFKIDLVDVCA